MNMSPPMTMATSASDRASGPVNVNARLFAARSHGACANAGDASVKASTNAAPICLSAERSDRLRAREDIRTQKSVTATVVASEHGSGSPERYGAVKSSDSATELWPDIFF